MQQTENKRQQTTLKNDGIPFTKHVLGQGTRIDKSERFNSIREQTFS